MKRNKFEIAATLIDKLWGRFRERVSYARYYNDLVYRHGGMVVLDHVGFRSLNTHTGEQPEGIWAFRHIFECLGYSLGRKYDFPGKKLKAIHLTPEMKMLPKIFVSQLEVFLLPQWVQRLLSEVVANTNYMLSESGIELLNKLRTDGVLTHEAANALEEELVHYFYRPWNPPPKETVLKVNDVNHYAAWVLLHGNAPSHFAVFLNEQRVPEWPDLKTTCRALQQAGIPMKRKIEGALETILQQSATLAVKEEVMVWEEGIYSVIPWTYAYLELIKRGCSPDGKEELFQDFLEAHERHLYQMTVTLEN